VALALLAGACGDGSGDGGGDGGGDDGSVVEAGIARVEPPPGAAEPVAEAIGAFGWDLYRELASADANLVFSPQSIGIALVMTRAGAAGETATEMDRVLHLDDVTDPHGGANALERAMAATAGEQVRPDGSTAEIVVDISNAIWAQEGFGFEEAFLSTLAESYGAGVRLVDYAGAHEAARERINEWVADRTADRIEELIGPGVVSPDTRAVLTNTVYLNAPWEHPFDDADTVTGPFTRLDGTETDAELMSASDSFRYARMGNLQAIELPYVGGQLSMVVLVPDPGAFEAVAADIDGATFAAVLDGLQATDVDLRFPAYGYTTSATLRPPLAALGMGSAFDPDRADFSAMSTEASLFVSDVVHEAFISVDEAGTEAAAATAVVMDLTAAPGDPVDVVVDRPFLFAIVHGDSRGVLFLGHVVDPLRPDTGDSG
jgi:serpin B